MKYLLILLLIFVNCAHATDRQGPDYYEFKFLDEKIQTEDKPQAKVSSTQIMTTLKAVHEEVLNTSILNPTEQNILHERMLAVLYMDIAERYKDRAQTVVSKTPKINYMLKHPVDDAALKLQESLDDNQRDARITKLTNTHGLFFFYAGNCSHCRAFAATIKRFAKKYGFEIIAISLDGVGLPEFPNFKKNNGQAEKLGVKSLPAVFAIDPKHGPQQSILLSYGNVSVAELTEKLDYNYRFLTGQVKYELLN